MKQSKSSNIKPIVVTAFFAAVIFVGIQVFRIPLLRSRWHTVPSFRPYFVMLAVLMLSPAKAPLQGFWALSYLTF